MQVQGGSQTQGYTVQLEVFEGPLDLLLHLIRQQEIDIYQIPITQITDQYLHYLEEMKDLNITIAGDFLVMAATLIHIKSGMLLPAEPGSQMAEEVEQSRSELVERLLEHEKFKQAAQMLYERETVELCVWPPEDSEFEDEEKELISANVFDLVSAFHRMVERYKDQIVMEIENEAVSFEEKLKEIRRLLKVQREFFFSLFFQKKFSRLHLAVTFFALLELTRLKEVRLVQKGLFKDICIRAC